MSPEDPRGGLSAEALEGTEKSRRGSERDPAQPRGPVEKARGMPRPRLCPGSSAVAPTAGKCSSGHASVCVRPTRARGERRARSPPSPADCSKHGARMFYNLKCHRNCSCSLCRGGHGTSGGFGFPRPAYDAFPPLALFSIAPLCLCRQVRERRQASRCGHAASGGRVFPPPGNQVHVWFTKPHSDL